ncbi:hypothetical protein HK102_011888 [Quaeritorhiza haematococci]|nr:hypothetical protein HK102_011888 [Quaeritorhiza haematococci]
MSNPTPALAHLLPPTFKQTVSQWLAEDTPSFDVGGYVVGESEQVAILYAKAKGVLAGVPFFDEVFRQVDCRARKLNLLKEKHGWKGMIAGTRKTTPGFRLVEKYAMLVGGIDTHRMDLSSMIMLKDNHIWATGSITQAVQNARKAGGFSIKIEVECQSEEEANEAIAAGADIVMLDNFDGAKLHVAAKNLRNKWEGGVVTSTGRRTFLVEGSGGLTEENVVDYFSPGGYTCNLIWGRE